ncbi:MAG: hypothetical protein R3A79_08080 [Nannocystaceae bacterium]
MRPSSPRSRATAALSALLAFAACTGDDAGASASATTSASVTGDGETTTSTSTSTSA